MIRISILNNFGRNIQNSIDYLVQFDGSIDNIDKFKAENFSMFVGSEKKLIDNLKIGGAGVISATTQFSGSLAKKVYDDFKKTGSSNDDEKLKDIRSAFDETGNLITALHTLKSIENKAYANLLPPLELLNENKMKFCFKNFKIGFWI